MSPNNDEADSTSTNTDSTTLTSPSGVTVDPSLTCLILSIETLTTNAPNLLALNEETPYESRKEILDKIIASAQAIVLSGLHIKSRQALRFESGVDLGSLDLGSLDTSPTSKEHPNKTSSELPVQIPRPFLDTDIGRLPPEIRLVVWGYVLTAPCFPGITVNPDFRLDTQLPAKEAMVDSQAVCSPWPEAGAQDHRATSHIALLQTCRLIHQEVQGIFYSNNTFRFANSPSLFAFLTCTGFAKRKELQVLHVDGPLNWDDYKKYEISLGDSDVHKAAKMLRECKGIRKIFFNICIGEEFDPVLFLLVMHDFCSHTIEYRDEFRWYMRPCAQGEFAPWLLDEAIQKGSRPLNVTRGHDSWGNKRCVEVHTGRDGKEP